MAWDPSFLLKIKMNHSRPTLSFSDTTPHHFLFPTHPFHSLTPSTHLSIVSITSLALPPRNNFCQPLAQGGYLGWHGVRQRAHQCSITNTIPVDFFFFAISFVSLLNNQLKSRHSCSHCNQSCIHIKFSVSRTNRYPYSYQLLPHTNISQIKSDSLE